jgi:cyclic pyranopterin phosphate synthase
MVSANGVPITNIRIALTKRCNLACVYCHREGELPSNGVDREMSVEDIDTLLSVASDLGIRKVRFTGGEPLVRSDIVDIVRVASRHMDDVSISTNGVLLAPLATQLKEAGLNRANITLNTLSAATYKEITGTDAHADAVAGIEAAYEAGIRPIKINMVLMGCNKHEVRDMVSFLREGMVLQLIELISSKEDECGAFYQENVVDLTTYEAWLEDSALRIEERQKHRRKKYFIPQEVEVVRSMHNTTFCANCTSIRITSDGKIKKCLFDDHPTHGIEDFSDRDAVRDALLATIREKRPYWC